MEQLIITIEGKSNAELLTRLIRKFNFVKSVIRSVSDTEPVEVTGTRKEEKYDWINPSRPATDEEFELMISEAEAEKGIPSDEAKALTRKKIMEWKKQNLL